MLERLVSAVVCRCELARSRGRVAELVISQSRKLERKPLLWNEDEHGGDEKLICVPVDTTFPYYSDIAETKDLPSIIFQQIEHFFENYKDLEKGKWVKVDGWAGSKEALAEVEKAAAAYKG